MAERGLSISSAQPQPDFRIPASAGMTENRRGTAHVSGHSEPWLRECVGCDGGSWWCEPRSERRGRRRTATSTFAGSVRSCHLIGACGGPRDRLGAASASLLDAVEAVLYQRHRASSAIEGFNAALRPYLHVHKGATQGFLDLFGAWFNLRTRRWGRHKEPAPELVPECLYRGCLYRGGPAPTSA